MTRTLQNWLVSIRVRRALAHHKTQGDLSLSIDRENGLARFNGVLALDGGLVRETSEFDAAPTLGSEVGMNVMLGDNPLRCQNRTNAGFVGRAPEGSLSFRNCPAGLQAQSPCGELCVGERISAAHLDTRARLAAALTELRLLTAATAVQHRDLKLRQTAKI